MKVAVHAFVMAALIAAGAAGQVPPPAAPADVERLGPQVGQVVPDFSAVDQFGRTQTLKAIMGPNGAMLIFNRSADW
jgi:hypothetical protein